MTSHLKPQNTNTELTPLWRAADVARYLSCSKSSVYQKAEAGILPAIRIGGLLRFDPDTVRRWALSDSSSGARIHSLR